jgi:STE24 endopeptidase
MATFDPAAATAAYLATLSPAAHAKATAYTHGAHWLLLWDWGVTLAAAWLIVRSRLLLRAEERIERDRPRLILASVVAAVLYVTLDAVLESPWDIYAQWWREKQYGLTSQAFTGWLAEQGIGFAVSLVFSVLFLTALYALIRRAGRVWWAWASGLAIITIVFILVVAPALVEPLFNTYRQAPDGPMRQAVVALAEKTGTPADKIYIYNGSKQSNRYTANVSGLGGTARVAMSDTMFAKGADIAEVRAVVGHEMGHYRHRHIVWTALLYSVLAVAGLWLIDRLFLQVAYRMGADVDGIADPAGLPVIVVIAATLSLLATPLFNTVTRWEEADADSFSLRYANEPDGLAGAMVKTIEYRASSPSALEEFIFYDHPSVEHRVRKAMDWKAAHMGGAGR